MTEQQFNSETGFPVNLPYEKLTPENTVVMYKKEAIQLNAEEISLASELTTLMEKGEGEHWTFFCFQDNAENYSDVVLEISTGKSAMLVWALECAGSITNNVTYNANYCKQIFTAE